MSSRAASLAPLAVALLVCAGLTTRWVQARARSAELAAEIAGLRSTHVEANRPTATSAPFTTTAAPAAASTTIDPDIEARRALLAEARAIPYLARREAMLVAVRRIKAQHRAVPPPARALPPPYGAKYGGLFTELLSDPHYLALVREDWQTGAGSLRARRLDGLPISEETKKQVLDIEFDSYLATAEIANYTTPEEQQAALLERRRIQEENQARVRQLLGGVDPKLNATLPPSGTITSASPAPRAAVAQVAHSEVSSGPLAVRLSYSESPLTESDQEKLSALLSAMATPKAPAYRLWYDVEFFKQAQSILNPTQLEALRQLQEENEARTLRSRLPKSSELPRTTRRARLEGGE